MHLINVIVSLIILMTTQEKNVFNEIGYFDMSCKCHIHIVIIVLISYN